MLHRRCVLFGLLIAPLPLAARPCGVTRVLFVCPAGSVKSAIAREELRRAAKQQHVPIHAESRGVQPENHISAALARRLAEDHINPLRDPLRRFTPDDLSRADIVIAFDQAADVPALKSARVWQVAAWNSQYDEAKADLKENIARLLHELKQRPC
jgi:protein-tyrosine-phosphatase